jgi:hypothetical protein
MWTNEARDTRSRDGEHPWPRLFLDSIDDHFAVPKILNKPWVKEWDSYCQSCQLRTSWLSVATDVVLGTSSRLNSLLSSRKPQIEQAMVIWLIHGIKMPYAAGLIHQPHSNIRGSIEISKEKFRIFRWFEGSSDWHSFIRVACGLDMWTNNVGSLAFRALLFESQRLNLAIDSPFVNMWRYQDENLHGSMWAVTVAGVILSNEIRVQEYGIFM